MSKVIIGQYRSQPQGFKAFVPSQFPPPGISLSLGVSKKHAEAMRLIGKLDGYAGLLPDKDFFHLMFLRKDAASSSQIEGTQATMMDAIEAESKERASDLPSDVDNILHYIDAVDYGLERIKELPLSLRLIRELHKELMVGARSTHAPYPGEFRSSQNWIGGTSPGNARFVPPPVHEMRSSLGDLEKFMQHNANYLPLIKAGLLHAQFETIHPFNDGNGRTGRMLITMYLWHTKLLETPVLYLSSYFKQHQDVYYERLNGYHAEPSKFDDWLKFFLEGVIEIAHSSIATCGKITTLRERDMRKAQGLGKTSARSTIELLKRLYKQPIVSATDIRAWAGYSSRQAAYNTIDRLAKLDILKPLKEPETYGQRYIYSDYIKIFQDE
jgi:cell filamentation protein, protein adenylyltransferase